jgi:hypothetical protein
VISYLWERIHSRSGVSRSDPGAASCAHQAAKAVAETPNESGFPRRGKKCSSGASAGLYRRRRNFGLRARLEKKEPGVAAPPASKTSRKKGIRDVSLEARRHRDCGKAGLEEPVPTRCRVARRVASCSSIQADLAPASGSNQPVPPASTARRWDSGLIR